VKELPSSEAPITHAPTLDNIAAAAVPQSSPLERCVAHRPIGKVNKIEATRCGEFQKSRRTTTIVIAMIVATASVRFTRHRDCIGDPLVEGDRRSFLGHHRIGSGL